MFGLGLRSADIWLTARRGRIGSFAQPNNERGVTAAFFDCPSYDKINYELGAKFMTTQTAVVKPNITSVMSKLFAVACLLSSFLFCWYTVADAVAGFGVELAEPVGGAVSGRVALEAHATGEATDLRFEILSQDGSYRDIIAGLRGTSGSLVWVGAWSTDGLPEGDYLISAGATSSTGLAVQSETVLVTLENSDPGIADLTDPQIHISSPGSGDSMVGSVNFSAEINADADAVTFIISGGDLSAAVPKSAVPDVSGGWSATWDSRSVSDGRYTLSAQAAVGGRTVESDEVEFEVDNPDLSVNIISPDTGGEFTNTVSFVASTSIPVGFLEFEVHNSSGGVVAGGMRAQQGGSSDWMHWEYEWDSSAVNSGDYTVLANTDGAESLPTVFRLVDDSGVALDSTVDEPDLDTPEDVMVALYEPENRDEVSGLVEMVATSTDSAQSVSFMIQPQTNAGTEIELSAVRQSGTERWIALWDSETVVNGGYWVYALASDGITQATSQRISVVVRNDVLDEVLAVHISSPSSGDSLRGSVDLLASTTVEVDAVQFIASPLDAIDASNGSIMFGIASFGGRAWSATWETAELPAGEYQVLATATKEGLDVASAPIVVEVIDVGLQVGLLSPANDARLSGRVTLSANVSPRAVRVNFVLLKSSNSGEGVEIEAVAGSNAGEWAALLDTEEYSTGSYIIQAEAYNEFGVRYVSSPADVNILDEKSDILTDEAAGLSGEDGEFEGESDEPRIVVVSPAKDETASGEVVLIAEINAEPEEVYFVIVPANSSGARVSTVEAEPDSSGRWVASWDSSSVENGIHEIKARAGTETGSDINSEWVVFSVDNEITDQNVKLKIISPSQNAKVDGFVRIIVEVQGDIDTVSVVAESVTDENNSQRLSTSADGDNRWSAVWGTAGVTSGEYSLVAVANVGDAGEVSERVIVKVSEDGEHGEGYMDDAGESQYASGSGRAEILLVNPPPGPVRGVLLLLADIKGDVHGIRFVSRAHSDGQIVFSRAAAFDKKRGQWVSYWDTEVLKPGNYDLYVTGMDRFGQRLQSLSNTITKPEQIIQLAEEETKSRIIVEIPNEAVVLSVVEIPEGTQRPDSPEAEQDTSHADEQLNQECINAGISAERCDLWLARRYTSFTCRQMGIITKRECLAYLAEAHGGRIPQCAGYDTSECESYIARMTRGLLDDEQMDQIDGSIVPNIGKALVLPSSGEESTTGEQVPEEILNGAPIAGDGQVRVRVYASPAYTQVDEQTSRRSVPAVIFLDSDDDGLPDDAERRLGTDPNSVDTDNDGYNDAEEIRNDYNPLGAGRLGEDTADDRGGLAPVDEAVLSGLPIEQPLHAGVTNDLFTAGVRGFIVDAGTFADEDAGSTEDKESAVEKDLADKASLVFEGQASPNSVVTLFIYSYLPMMLTATTDDAGNWSYELGNSLVDGRHEVYVTVTDNTGRVVEKSQPFAFFVSAAEAVTEEDFFGVQVVEEESPFMAQEEVTKREFNWYILGAVLMAVLVLIIGIVIVARPRKQPILEDEF